MRKLNSETLDLLEERFIGGCLGDKEISGSVLEILRRVLDANARLTLSLTQPNSSGLPTESLSTPGGEEESENMLPDYGGKVLNFK